MSNPGKSDDEQWALWNGPAGQTWIEAQDALDAMFRPFEELLVQAAAERPSASVLDVGCGTGSTTIAMAKRLGPGGRCVGIDISAPMLERARLHAERDGARASFVHADAELHAFTPASFDLIVSRFGVMFFNGPVRAFANLRQAARGGARLYCFAWRSLAENPFMTAAERAAAPLLSELPVPEMPPRAADAPGQFAFADPNRVRGILEQSGWTDLELRPLDVECSFPEADLTRYVTRLGPLGRVLRDADEQTRQRVLATVRPAFEPYVRGDLVRFNAACWAICAGATS